MAVLHIILKVAERLFGRADIAEVYWEKDESKLDIERNAKYTINQFNLKINNLLFEDTAEYTLPLLIELQCFYQARRMCCHVYVS
jgi:hypothetical protein